MQQIFSSIQYLIGNRDILERMESVQVLPLFSECVLDFLDCLSKRLMDSSEAKKYPDVIAFAFWIRRASLYKVSVAYKDAGQRIGRGVAFHIAPSNIPVQFAVSMIYALTAGNASVIRISDKKFEQVNIICKDIDFVLSERCPEMKPYICIIRYTYNDEVTQALTDLCDIRMIWGGNRTIATIRKASIRARCIDLGFADRYSVAVIDSDDYLERDSDLLASDFYNDTYFSDQNACSAPRLVIWTGNSIAKAKEVFWDALEKVIHQRYTMDPICSSEKLLKTAVFAAAHPGIKEIKKDNLLVRIELPLLYDNIMDFKGNCGYFFEYSADKLENLLPIMKKDCQTITYIGEIEDDLRRIIKENGVRGVDRIVPVGHAADITFVWDGLNLPDILSRRIGNL